MQKLLIVLFVILVLKIQSFGCEFIQLKPSLLQNIEQNFNTSCSVVFENSQKKSAVIACKDKSYSVSYDKNSIYFLTQTISKYPTMSQCWVEGVITNKCDVKLAAQKCQTWDMKD